MPTQKLTGKPEELAAFIDKFDIFLFDCDGVLWQGKTLLPKTAETLAHLRTLGKRLLFVTNNSTKSRATYKTKLEELGIPCEADEIFCSAYSSAIYISRVLKLPRDKRVYVIGEAGIEEELAAEGVSHFRDEAGGIRPEDYDNFGPDEGVGVVLCGLDHEISYRKLARAYQYLRNPETVFLATNIDSTFPTHGKLFPGAGSMSAPLTYMTGRTPVSLGKPSQAMMDAIEGVLKFDRKRACMVGDRLNTDIRFGIEGGLGGTLAVLTGVSTEEEILEEGATIVPDVYLDRLCDILG
ncbi:2-phosphoglycolate phosphatase [Choiromyces venosus 120613-1]|uniref:4-nitrophenylphosphatase n=1 Tax=Choiromyces venosus 120613-1 TaxID=1336337 RepID=A0A3N4K2H1_9PEZI|nr:2-phosphoglycolate phosphatase [Choiromyces venosus 120613-1]